MRGFHDLHPLPNIISKWLGSCEHVTYEEIMKQRNISDGTN
jgi:hypothetical protein